MSPPATTPVPAPIRRARSATKVPISPGVSERRTRTFRATTQAARAARQPQDPLELTANHFGLLQGDEEQVFNLTIAEASKDYGTKPVKDAIKSEISSLITDTGALEPCKTSGQQPASFAPHPGAQVRRSRKVHKDESTDCDWREPTAQG